MTRSGDQPSLTGDLQAAIMRALWDGGPGSVEDVRSRLPEAQRGAYTTVQTVLNRLTGRGMLRRQRRGKGKVLLYSPAISEAEYVSASLRRTLSSASSAARSAALAEIIGSLDAAELRKLRGQARAIERLRRR